MNPPSAYFEKQLPGLLASNPSWLGRFRHVVQFHVEGTGGGDWVLDATVSPPRVSAGRSGGATCELRCSSAVLGAMASGQLTPRQAFDLSSLRVSGSFPLAMKLGVLFVAPSTH